MTSDFLPRAHSRRLGQLDVSNWKNLASKHNLIRVDPAIREIISILNMKGYTTFSSCSGGHSSKLRRRFDRHESGYLAFSPPSKIAFTLYRALARKNRDFGFEAQAVIDDGDGWKTETLCTRLYWQLRDERPAKREYYDRLFAQMKQVVMAMGPAGNDYREVLTGLLGKRELSVGLHVIRKQMRRFKSGE